MPGKLIVGRGGTRVVPLTEADVAQRKIDHDKHLAKLEAEANSKPEPSMQEQIDALKAMLIEEDPTRERKIEEKLPQDSKRGVSK